MYLFVIGIFEKTVLADGISAPVADKLFSFSGVPGIWDAWCGILAFSIQIYCDFAGYSTCAIGVAMCLGFSLPDNFRFPYGAAGFSEFWKRWHISLSTWLRDYLYIPLGGSRYGSFRTAVNLMITMLLGGLWHGASWTFVVWGALHGVFLIVERVVVHLTPAQIRRLKNPALPLLIVATFVLTNFAWVFFRAESWAQAIRITTAMIGLGENSAEGLFDFAKSVEVFALAAVLVGFHSVMRHRTIEDLFGRMPEFVRAIAIAGMLIAIATMSGNDRAFIYFQF
jgi:D-alanyl-lipoteichoic acid acyltransferase DltB (MBOAT superfamily)